MTDSSFGRLFGVLVSPQPTFTSIRNRPTWLVVLVVLLLCLVALGWAMHERTDYREVVTRSMEAFGGADQVPPDRLESQIEMREQLGGVFAALGAVVAGVIYLVLAAIYLVAFRLFGSELTYKQSLSTFLHGIVPMAVYCLLAAPLILQGGDLSYEQVMTRNVLASNLSFLAPEGASMALKSFLIGLDFFALWTVVLLTIGYRIVARVSTALAAGTAVFLFLLGLGLRVGMAALFS